MLSMYAKCADILLRETQSVVVTVTPKPNVLVVGTTIAAFQGTAMADMLTRPSPSTTRDWGLLSYCEDGAFVTGVTRLDTAYLTKVTLKMMDTVLPMAGAQGGQDRVVRLKALLQDMSSAVDNEMAFSARASPQSKPCRAFHCVWTVKDKDRLLKCQDQMLELWWDVRRQPDSMYQGETIRSSMLMCSVGDPNSPEAQYHKKMYGEGHDCRMAVLDRVAVMTLGADADVNMENLIDQAKAGPKQEGSEMKSALALLPEAKNADILFTLNVPRMVSSLNPDLVSIPVPARTLPSRGNLVLAATIDKGKANVLVAMPKEHLTELVQFFQQMSIRR